MTVEQAEKLVCPFISTDRPDTPDWAYCLTTKCMAWKSTTTEPVIYGERCTHTGYCKKLGED